MTAVTSTGTSSGVFDPWLHDEHWAGSTLTYSFPLNGATYSYMSTGSVTPISASQQAAVHQILDEIASFTGLNFVEIAESNSTKGDLRFATDPAESGAYAYLPVSVEEGGDAFFGPVTDNPNIGNEAYLYFTHEIGHAMGLNHGHEYPTFVNSGFDSQEYTVVTYTDYVGDTDSDFNSGPIDWAQSYMQLDIAAMQFLYGANYSTSGEVWSGDTTYRFDPTTGEMSINGVGMGTPAGNRIFRTIWDGDGDDTYNLSNYTTDLEINLAAGGWSTFSDAQLADLNTDSSSSAFDARGNVANAQLVGGDERALIENAIGGKGDDTILGNSADNFLKGKGGKDFLNGRSGADTLVGNSGKDKLKGGLGGDRLEGGDGRDKLFGETGNDVLIGEKGNDLLFGGNGNDVLRGRNDNDILVGGAGKDVLYGGGGADTFRYKTANDSKLGGNSDIIKDFTKGTDFLDLSGLASGTMSLALNGSFSGSGASVITKKIGGEVRVLVDVDGDSNADFRVFLDGTTSVGTGDFVL